MFSSAQTRLPPYVDQTYNRENIELYLAFWNSNARLLAGGSAVEGVPQTLVAQVGALIPKQAFDGNQFSIIA